MIVGTQVSVCLFLIHLDLYLGVELLSCGDSLFSSLKNVGFFLTYLF